MLSRIYASFNMKILLNKPIFNFNATWVLFVHLYSTQNKTVLQIVVNTKRGI